MHNLYFDKQGKPLTDTELDALLRDRHYRRVGLDSVGEVKVSTVWLGVNYNWGDGAPIIFESMIFGGDRNGDMVRYSTLEQAEAGHRAILAELDRAITEAMECQLEAPTEAS